MLLLSLIPKVSRKAAIFCSIMYSVPENVDVELTAAVGEGVPSSLCPQLVQNLLSLGSSLPQDGHFTLKNNSAANTAKTVISVTDSDAWKSFLLERSMHSNAARFRKNLGAFKFVVV